VSKAAGKMLRIRKGKDDAEDAADTSGSPVVPVASERKRDELT
jgi:hypothetical protein